MSDEELKDGRKELFHLINKKERITNELARLERQIYDYEGTYMEQDNEFGNVITGYNFIENETSSSENDTSEQLPTRMFSQSSVTSFAAVFGITSTTKENLNEGKNKMYNSTSSLKTPSIAVKKCRKRSSKKSHSSINMEEEGDISFHSVDSTISAKKLKRGSYDKKCERKRSKKLLVSINMEDKSDDSFPSADSGIAARKLNKESYDKKRERSNSKKLFATTNMNVDGDTSFSTVGSPLTAKKLKRESYHKAQHSMSKKEINKKCTSVDAAIENIEDHEFSVKKDEIINEPYQMGILSNYSTLQTKLPKKLNFKKSKSNSAVSNAEIDPFATENVMLEMEELEEISGVNKNEEIMIISNQLYSPSKSTIIEIENQEITSLMSAIDEKEVEVPKINSYPEILNIASQIVIPNQNPSMTADHLKKLITEKDEGKKFQKSPEKNLISEVEFTSIVIGNGLFEAQEMKNSVENKDIADIDISSKECIFKSSSVAAKESQKLITEKYMDWSFQTSQLENSINTEPYSNSVTVVTNEKDEVTKMNIFQEVKDGELESELGIPNKSFAMPAKPSQNLTTDEVISSSTVSSNDDVVEREVDENISVETQDEDDIFSLFLRSKSLSMSIENSKNMLAETTEADSFQIQEPNTFSSAEEVNFIEAVDVVIEKIEVSEDIEVPALLNIIKKSQTKAIRNPKKLITKNGKSSSLEDTNQLSSQVEKEIASSKNIRTAKKAKQVPVLNIRERRIRNVQLPKLPSTAVTTNKVPNKITEESRYPKRLITNKGKISSPQETKQVSSKIKKGIATSKDVRTAKKVEQVPMLNIRERRMGNSQLCKLTSSTAVTTNKPPCKRLRRSRRKRK